MALGIDFDRCEIRIRRQQAHAAAAVFELLDRDFVVESCDDDAAMLRDWRAMHRDQVAVEDACIAHTEPDDAQQVIRARMEQSGIDAVLCFDVFRGEDGAAGGNPADEG